MSLVNVFSEPTQHFSLYKSGNLDFYIELFIYFSLAINNG